MCTHSRTNDPAFPNSDRQIADARTAPIPRFIRVMDFAQDVSRRLDVRPVSALDAAREELSLLSWDGLIALRDAAFALAAMVETEAMGRTPRDSNATV